MELLALAVLGVAAIALLGALAWVFPRGVAGLLSTLGAFGVALFASLELQQAGLSAAYAYVAGFALAQPALVVVATLPRRFDADRYWRRDRLACIALDVSLVVAVGAVAGALAVLALAGLGLVPGDRGTLAMSAVTLGAIATFMLRTRRFRTDAADESLATVSL